MAEFTGPDMVSIDLNKLVTYLNQKKIKLEIDEMVQACQGPWTKEMYEEVVKIEEERKRQEKEEKKVIIKNSPIVPINQ